MGAAGQGGLLRAIRGSLTHGTLVRQTTFGLFSRLVARRANFAFVPGVVQRANDSAMRLVDVSEQRKYGPTNHSPVPRIST
jgi:hypothetical protein